MNLEITNEKDFHQGIIIIETGPFGRLLPTEVILKTSKSGLILTDVGKIEAIAAIVP